MVAYSPHMPICFSTARAHTVSDIVAMELMCAAQALTLSKTTSVPGVYCAN